jgi:hypothetical protein
MSWVETRASFDDGKLIFERVQDVEPILDHNKALQNTAQKRGDFRHIGTIPNVILEKWMNEEGAPVLTMSKDEFARFIRRKLNDPDWRHLRTDK